MDEWQERQIAAEFAIMQLADLVRGLCIGLNAGDVWDQRIADVEHSAKPTTGNVVSMLGADTTHHTQRISTLVLGLLQGRDPSTVLQELRGGSTQE